MKVANAVERARDPYSSIQTSVSMRFSRYKFAINHRRIHNVEDSCKNATRDNIPKCKIHVEALSGIHEFSVDCLAFLELCQFTKTADGPVVVLQRRRDKR
jgi:hypothetical protein